MRLSSPFVRIPLVVDATRIAVEVDALPDRVWRPHPEGAPGNSAVPLVARDGDPDDDRAFGMMRSTPHLERLPYTRRVLAALDSVIGRSRLMRIEEEGELGAHVDTNYYWRDHLRVHVPVHTSPAVRFTCEGESVHMGPGEVWVFDTWRPHSVINPADAARVHLVVDTVGGVPLWNLIDAPEREPVAVAVDGPEPTIPTETVNRPWVMSPWELEHALTAIADELMATEPELGRRLRSVTVDHTRAWRNLWARYGDAP
ncbi:MAG TPA: aspartyl/asparaginyl beta-hydroxylase domain-containing protein, partial [Acidimicrobiia bacterium]|nr:aspartyl/asparaginyl beta-hydroxylase domain-containing protein [Acidimicrobiia bacterium]